jgi:hypothetical protein
MSKIRGFSLSTQETEYSVSCVEETGPLSIPNPFQRYPIYLTLHKILDGTHIIADLKSNLYPLSISNHIILKNFMSMIYSKTPLSAYKVGFCQAQGRGADFVYEKIFSNSGVNMPRC